LRLKTAHDHRGSMDELLTELHGDDLLPQHLTILEDPGTV
jgi:hypothetical protein